jgi:hypothetical protein
MHMLAVHVAPSQTSSAQQGSPETPQNVHVPAEQTVVVSLQVSPGQQASPSPPHSSQVFVPSHMSVMPDVEDGHVLPGQHTESRSPQNVHEPPSGGHTSLSVPSAAHMPPAATQTAGVAS